MSEYDGQLSELGEAARRAGEIVLEQIDAMVGAAENRAGEIREGAELHAEGKHRETMESARRVFERLEALERPLGELAMTLGEEKERFAGELDQGGRVRELPAGAVNEQASAAVEETQAEANAHPEAEGEGGPAPESASGWAWPSRSADEAEVGDAPERVEGANGQPDPEQGSGADASSPPPASSKPTRRFLRRRRARSFVDFPGQCAVCERPFQAESNEHLQASGWRVSGDVGVCPECQAKGWELSRSVKQRAGSTG